MMFSRYSGYGKSSPSRCTSTPSPPTSDFGSGFRPRATSLVPVLLLGATVFLGGGLGVGAGRFSSLTTVFSFGGSGRTIAGWGLGASGSPSSWGGGEYKSTL